mmetsp:Transcript_17360/g.22806  ORF Transcript_17360/g.22806 Transcript_17360/m.22806 type:complete len:254 (-) Transcript_17360:144-905(-)|eukprot:CAMPEP_0195264368 /NCGR_PEP_ID=MMETSP0706-20130129/10819_1 /TAXON_ID=33640 /ORGANISM="Asterionellopsis glacialis, Strain CCMP134" /LENGTH=253 /DNA_ID=CAMNT_0040318647 /DNA_START=24 /DNA_END=785 /DNA_ORIENTATION=-
MDLATPAPNVEPAFATAARESSEKVIVESAVPSGAPDVESARPVGAAETVDDPRKYAPAAAKQKPKPSLLGAAALRGKTGSDFESNAAVLRGAPKKDLLKRFLPLCFDERDFVAYGEVERFVLIKGNCCFVFTEETDPSPLYSIPLEELVPKLEDPRKPDKHSVTISPKTVSANAAIRENVAKEAMKTVLLKYRNGKQAYQFTFDASDDATIAQRFLDALERGQKSSDGHVVGQSVLNAKAAGKEHAKAQPMI